MMKLPNHNVMPASVVNRYTWQILMILDKENGAREVPSNSKATLEKRLQAFDRVCKLVDQKSR